MDLINIIGTQIPIAFNTYEHKTNLNKHLKIGGPIWDEFRQLIFLINHVANMGKWAYFLDEHLFLLSIA